MIALVDFNWLLLSAKQILFDIPFYVLGNHISSVFKMLDLSG